MCLVTLQCSGSKLPNTHAFYIIMSQKMWPFVNFLVSVALDPQNLKQNVELSFRQLH